MRRATLLLSVAALALVGLAAARPGPGAVAQDGTPAAAHPLVGTWRTTLTEGGEAFPTIDTFAADGAVVSIDAPVHALGPDFVVFESPALGTWEATGDDSDAYTFELFSSDAQGNPAGVVTVSGTRRASDDGQSATGEYAYSVVDPDGNVIAAGRGTDESTRLAVVPMDSLATPAASPAA